MSETMEKPAHGEPPSKEEVAQRKRDVKNTFCCPYCGEKLKKWQVPQTVFTEWPNEFMYICLNDECSYFTQGWDAMAAMGRHCSFRLMYDPITDSCNPIPISNASTLKDGIVEEE
jgi:hypothetical protein